jgi:hypothetical protein
LEEEGISAEGGMDGSMFGDNLSMLDWEGGHWGIL